MKDTFGRLKNINKSDITLQRVVAAVLRRLANIPHLLAWYVPWGFAKENREKLRAFGNIHAGKRCFILANGPSLKKVDFSLLKDEVTIGMNRIYLMEQVNGFRPSYLACIDRKSQLLQFTGEFNGQEGTCFYEWNLRKHFDKKKNFIFIKGKFSPAFSTDPVKDPFGNGRTVTYTCMQIAYYMGFAEVYLIGKDHSYNTEKKAGVGITSTGTEDNHFIRGYYKKGQNWDAPDYMSEEFAYSLAKKAFEDDKRIINDATESGKLNVFEKIDFTSLFHKTT